METDDPGDERPVLCPAQPPAPGVTLGLSLRPAGPSFHLKNGGDENRLDGMRIREIRDVCRLF